MNDLNSPIQWSPGVTLDAIERQVILKAYRFFRFNKTATANALGIAIRTLDNKLERYEYDDKERAKLDAEQAERNRDFLNRQRGIPRPSINDSPEEREAQRKALLPGADARMRLEPAPEAIAQSPVSLPERTQVQTVLSGQTPSRHSRRSR